MAEKKSLKNQKFFVDTWLEDPFSDDQLHRVKDCNKTIKTIEIVLKWLLNNYWPYSKQKTPRYCGKANKLFKMPQARAA